MTQHVDNPLHKYFRQPAIYIKLPSQGQFWAENSLNLPVNKELPVYPMTARDEITIRTPDALLNGQGVVDVIQSCVPGIIDAWKMPSVDVDAVLIAIRIASYGAKMDFDTKCPKCSEESSFTLDISQVLNTMGMPDYSTPLAVSSLKVQLKPQPYYEVNRINQLNFTEQQIYRTINDDSLTEEIKKAKTDAYLKKLVDLNIEVCVNSIESITIEDGTVVKNTAHIRDFFELAPFNVIRIIQDKLKELGNQTSFKPLHVTCSSCSHEYDMPVTFDYSNFFDRGF